MTTELWVGVSKAPAGDKRYKDRAVKEGLRVFVETLGLTLNTRYLGQKVRQLKEKERYYIEHQGGCVFRNGRLVTLTFMS